VTVRFLMNGEVLFYSFNKNKFNFIITLGLFFQGYVHDSKQMLTASIGIVFTLMFNSPSRSA
jgi:hypothetical protein